MDFMYKTAPISKSKDPEKLQRVLFAALSGFIAGTIATLASSYINIWLFPDLPLHLDWSRIFIAWILWAVVGGLLAGISGFSAEGWKSILLSAVSMTSTILLLSSMQSSENTNLKIVAFVGLLFPISAMVLPLAIIFFWLARRFIRAVSERGWARNKLFLVNFIVILALGMVPGLYAKMNARAERGVRIVHGILQDAPGTIHEELLKTEGFSEHADQPYTLSQTDSAYSTVGVDVTAHYEDGYTIICTVVLYPGSDPSISFCKSKLP